MFSKLALVVATAFAILVAAAPAEKQDQCPAGHEYCCESLQKANTDPAHAALSSVGAQVDGNVPVGLTCSPLTAAGVSGKTCSQKPVCCDGNNFNGDVVVGCTAINV